MLKRSLILLAITLCIPLSALAESLRVSATWLNEHLSKDKLVIIDTRNPEDFEMSHIPGAVNLPDKLTYLNKQENGLIAEPNTIEPLFREKGLDHDSFAVIYDDGKMIDAARVFWTLEVYGIQEVRVLDGGFTEWSEKGFKVSDQAIQVKPSKYVTRVNHRRIASKLSTRLASMNPRQSVIDARSSKAYRGEVSTAKRYGHIPSAVNISVHEHFNTKANNANYLLSLEALKNLYSDVPKSEKVVLYCEVGRVSTTNYLVLRELGYDVANYDASWREWANDFNLPIEK